MNEEEKKAIERIEDTFYSDLGKGINNFQKITLYEDSIRDVRILLNLIEKLQKENEELKEDRDKFKKALGKRITYCNELEKDLFENCSNYVIPIQKVKAKIEELDIEISTCEYADDDSEEYKQQIEKDKRELLIAKKVLQQLLEENKKS